MGKKHNILNKNNCLINLAKYTLPKIVALTLNTVFDLIKQSEK